MLRQLGAAVAMPEPALWAGVPTKQGPHIVLGVDFAPSLRALSARLPSPAAVTVSRRSTLVVQGAGDLTLESVDLDGALFLTAGPGVALTVRLGVVANKGWAFVATEGDGKVHGEATQIRGYTVEQREQKVVAVTERGSWLLDDSGLTKLAAAEGEEL
jgi:hypothetical protein